MTTILKAHGPADLLAMVPALVGFEPRNSLVLLGFQGKRTCGAMRVDLPPHQGAEARVVASMVRCLAKIPGLDNAAIVIRTDKPWPSRLGAPHVRLAKQLARALRREGIGVRESLCHSSTAWGSYLDEATPPGGHPLSEIDASLIHHELPDDVREERMRPLAEGRIPDADPDTMEAVAKDYAALEQLWDRLTRSSPGAAFGTAVQLDEDWGALEVCRDLPLFVEGVLDWDDRDILHGAALLLFVLKGPPVRDNTMLQWATNIVVGDALYDDPFSFGDLVMGEGPRPDPDRITRGIAVLTAVVSRAEDAQRPPLLCMLAWLNWALGMGSRAGRHVDEALAIDPDYGMAQLLETMLSQGILPQWAFAP